MYKTILLAIDLADEESTAKLLSAARQLAAPSNAELCVMTVVPEDLSIGIAKRGKEDTLVAAQRRLRELTERELPGQRVKQVIAYGSAEEEILRVARETRADLIVVASHRPRARDLLLGSTAAQVVRRASCSVLVLR
ncbi:MAG TPA: universal stress protein [Kiloniellales bacterium]|nr:universal stress protein [Kiloniellales bacterium]